MSDALAVVRDVDGSIEKASVLMGRANDVASVCRAVVLNLAVEIHGKRYLPVEAWSTIAAAYGCIPSIREVIEEERGIRAVAELRTHTGTVLATAEGYVGLDEPTWANRPMFARRAMSQTRAISRVCRSAFAFVVSLMDAGLQTTPMEEMAVIDPSMKTTPDQTPQPMRAVGDKTRPPERSKMTQVRFGRTKGKYLCDIPKEDLDWQLAAAQKSVAANDPKWGSQNQTWLTVVQNEVQRRGDG